MRSAPKPGPTHIDIKLAPIIVARNIRLYAKWQGDEHEPPGAKKMVVSRQRLEDLIVETLRKIIE